MPSAGYYSIEVQITNDTATSFAIQAATTDGENDVWITNEQPHVGSTLSPAETLMVGVSTDDQDGPAGGSVSLTASGADEPVAITFQVPPEEGGVNVVGPTAYSYTTQQVQTSEGTHAMYQVTILGR
jgi:hypothetical protein